MTMSILHSQTITELELARAQLRQADEDLARISNGYIKSPFDERLAVAKMELSVLMLQVMILGKSSKEMSKNTDRLIFKVLFIRECNNV